MRVGIGYDIHALKKGRKLVLGGVTVPYPKGLVGHSDGDALFHALVDATLGAAAAGDIGDHFPDTDKRFQGMSGKRFAGAVTAILKKRGLRVAHMDAVIVAEAPKLSPFKESIRRNLAAAFGVPVAHVGLKTKTNEGFGAVGKNQAIACHAVVSLEKIRK